MLLLSFDEAIEKAETIRNSKGTAPVNRHLILGNGFSIALDPTIFTYSSLFQRADFSDNPEIKSVFKELDTTDFEDVINMLENAAKVITYYLPKQVNTRERMRRDAQKIKEVLIETIASNHPARPGDIEDHQYDLCTSFLSRFLKQNGRIYTLNYDILLYWVLMNSGVDFDDGFREDPDDPDADYVYWTVGEAPKQNVYYLHGALHLFDAGYQLRKFTWVRTAIPLIDQARSAISEGYLPLFVSEGSSEKMMAKITHSGYLHKGLRSLGGVGGCLFTYGWSLSENDEHVIRKIERGKVGNVFVGIHGNPTSENSRRIIERAQRMESNRKKRNLFVDFYDSSSVQIWGD
jgi:hypothetical protein